MGKKGIMISWVTINGKTIEACQDDGSTIKLTRAQRDLLAKYKMPNYIAEIKKAFSNDHIVANDFVVSKDGEIVFDIKA